MEQKMFEVVLVIYAEAIIATENIVQEAIRLITEAILISSAKRLSVMIFKLLCFTIQVLLIETSALKQLDLSEHIKQCWAGMAVNGFGTMRKLRLR